MEDVRKFAEVLKLKAKKKKKKEKFVPSGIFTVASHQLFLLLHKGWG